MSCRSVPPRLDQWAAVDGGTCPFEAPELRPIKLVGTVSNHPVLEDGTITTSLIQMIDEDRGVAWSISTKYELGAPSASFAAERAMLGAPLKYNSDRVTRVAEQITYRAARVRRSSAAKVDEPVSVEVANAPSLYDHLYNAASAPPLRRPCTTGPAPPAGLRTASATSQRHLCGAPFGLASRGAPSVPYLCHLSATSVPYLRDAGQTEPSVAQRRQRYGTPCQGDELHSSKYAECGCSGSTTLGLKL